MAAPGCCCAGRSGQERSGPPVGPPARQGFGTELIRNEASYNPGGSAALGFQPDGLLATIRFPEAPEDVP